MLIQGVFVVAQQKKVLVVPFTRFQLDSEFKIEELDKFNEGSSAEVYDQYVKCLEKAFNNFNDELVSFEVLSGADYTQNKKFIRCNLGKFKGKNYNQSSLKLFDKEQYSELLKSYDADLLLTVNWYSIDKAIHTVFIGDRNKRMKYSQHKLDYDVYDMKQERILGKGNQKLFCGDFPSESIINSKSLNASELAPCYGELIQDLVKAIIELKP